MKGCRMRVQGRRRTAGEREQRRVEQGQAGQREQDEADAHDPVVGRSDAL
jgi:hypothetical protein